MARLKDIHGFDSEAYRATVRTMRARGESVHHEGQRHHQETGTLHPYVDVKQNRGSHNAMIPEGDGQFKLANGIALPILNMFDGTGSTAHWLEDFFHACERQYKLMEGARPRYNTQLASAVVQDVFDHYPVVQISQFESDERSAEQVRLLLPASNGGDAPEDYDLGLVMGLFLYADIWKYELKGYLTLTADEIGRGLVRREDVNHHLGQSLEGLQSGNQLETAEVCRQLSSRWHVFLLQVPSGGRDLLPHTTRWWTEVLGAGRIIPVQEPRLLAEVRAGLIYVSEAANPTKSGLTEFLQSGDQSINAADIEKVWGMLLAAEQHFGAQSKLPGYHDIPRPGDIFADIHHAWPIGHPRAGENTTVSATV